MTTNTVLLSAETYPITGIPKGWPIGIDTGVTTDFSLISYGTCSFDVDWGDGNTETVDNVGPTTTFTTTHNYSTPGTYTVEITLNSGDFRPYYNNNPAGGELVTLADTPAGWSFGTDLSVSFTSAGITTIGNIDTSAVTNFESAWNGCTSLASFPLIDTSNGDNFFGTWRQCSMTSFPPLDTSSGTNFDFTWQGSGLTSFTAIDLSSGTNFSYAWSFCTSMTSFPAFPADKRPVAATTFNRAWNICLNLADFPANFFDNWTGTPANDCFTQAWDICPKLTATSVENILNSIDASGRSAPVSGFDIMVDYSVATGTPNVATAVTNLKARGWTITLNGVAQ